MIQITVHLCMSVKHIKKPFMDIVEAQNSFINDGVRMDRQGVDRNRSLSKQLYIVYECHRINVLTNS